MYSTSPRANIFGNPLSTLCALRPASHAAVSGRVLLITDVAVMPDTYTVPLADDCLSEAAAGVDTFDHAALSVSILPFAQEECSSVPAIVASLLA
jgi:hypothetical protein